MTTKTRHTYSVEFINPAGERITSRYFDTLRAARSWVRWMSAQSYVRSARIMQGGGGGVEVK